MLRTMSKVPDAPLHRELVEPALIPFLLAQSSTSQVIFAGELHTTQQRMSRVANGKAELSAREFIAAAARLALGRPSDDDWRDERGNAVPTWVVTRWHASTLIEPPPVTRNHELPAFLSFREAELTADYLRCFLNTGNPIAIPVWRSWLRESLETRGLTVDALRPLVPPGDDDMVVLQAYVDQVSDMQRGLLRACIVAGGR